MDEATLIRQIEAHMKHRGISQAALGRLLAPESASPRQVAYAYLSGRRHLLTGNGRKILDALGLDLMVLPKRT